MQPLKDPVIAQFWKLIAPVHKQIVKAYLFGSRAREEGLPDSDYDILLVVPERNPKIINRLYDAVMKVLLEQEQYISLKVFAKKTFDRLASIPTPFMEEIIKEGIPIV